MEGDDKLCCPGLHSGYPPSLPSSGIYDGQIECQYDDGKEDNGVSFDESLLQPLIERRSDVEKIKANFQGVVSSIIGREKGLTIDLAEDIYNSVQADVDEMFVGLNATLSSASYDLVLGAYE